jgi:membrane protein implicated in regulation of membrane protease activity
VSDVLWRERFRKRCDERVRKDREKKLIGRRRASGMDVEGDEGRILGDDEEDEDEKEVSVSAWR